MTDEDYAALADMGSVLAEAEQEADLQIRRQSMPNAVRGLLGGIDTTQGLAYGATALAGKAVGSERLQDWGVEGMERNMEEAASYGESPEFGSDPLGWANYNLGAVFPTLVEAGTGAAIGAGIGSAVAPGPGTVGGGVTGAISGSALVRQAVKRVGLDMAKDYIEKRGRKALTGELRDQIEARAQRAVLGKMGGRAGAVGATFQMEAGGNFGEAIDEIGVDDASVTSAIVTAIPAALIETVGGNIRILDKVLDSKYARIAKEGLQKNDPGMVARAIVEGTKQAPAEAGQESFQEAMSLANLYLNNPESEGLSLENVKARLGESAGVGFLGGVVFGGSSGAATRARSKPKDTNTSLKDQGFTVSEDASNAADTQIESEEKAEPTSGLGLQPFAPINDPGRQLPYIPQPQRGKPVSEPTGEIIPVGMSPDQFAETGQTLPYQLSGNVSPEQQTERTNTALNEQERQLQSLTRDQFEQARKRVASTDNYAQLRDNTMREMRNLERKKDKTAADNSKLGILKRRMERLTAVAPEKRTNADKVVREGDKEFIPVMKRQEFRNILPEYTRQMVQTKDQMGMGTVTDTDVRGHFGKRTPSTNPEWAQDAISVVGSVKGLRNAVDKAARGERLGENQRLAVEMVADAYSRERVEAGLEDAKQRRIDTQNNTRILKAAEGKPSSRFLEMDEREQAVYAEMDEETRSLHELMTQAQNVVPENELDGILESDRSDGEIAAELYRLIEQGAQDGRQSEEGTRADTDAAPETRQGEEVEQVVSSEMEPTTPTAQPTADVAIEAGRGQRSESAIPSEAQRNAGYDKRRTERVARAKEATTTEQLDAIMREEESDNDRHHEGYLEVRSAVDDKRMKVEADVREKQSQEAYKNGEWVNVPNAKAGSSKREARRIAQEMAAQDEAHEYNYTLDTDGFGETYQVVRRKKPVASQTQDTKPVASDETPDTRQKPDLPTERMKFVERKVEELGSIEAVDKKYAGDAKVDKYARDYARRTFAEVDNTESAESEPGQTESKPDQETEKTTTSQPKDEETNYGSSNKLVSRDRAAELREKLRAKLDQLNSGIDPEMLAMGTELAVYHIEAGARSFAQFAKAVTDDLGEKARPFLKSWYMGAKNWPGMDKSGMDSEAHVDSVDVDNLTGETSSRADIAEFIRNDTPALVGEYLRDKNNRFESIVGARRFIAQQAERETGEQVKIVPGTENAKAAEEAIEQGVVIAARSIVRDGKSQGKSSEAIYDDLVSLTDRQPKLGTRTSGSMRRQAYSTPMPISFAVSRLTGINGKASVYEPTAGNGALLLEADKGKVRANEMDKARADFLKEQGFKTTQKDALEVSGIEGQFDAVIANPPFGPIKENGGRQNIVFDVTDQYSTTQIDHAISLTALDAMRDGGRAALIIGSINPQKTSEQARKEAYNTQRMRGFYYNLYQKYNVTDHFTISGDLYSKQGAGWPLDVIIIDGKGKSDLGLPAVNLPRKYESFADLKGVLSNETDILGTGKQSTQNADSDTPASGRDGKDVGGISAEAVEAGDRQSQGGRRTGVDGRDDGGTRPDGQRQPGDRESARPAELDGKPRDVREYDNVGSGVGSKTTSRTDTQKRPGSAKRSGGNRSNGLAEPIGSANIAGQIKNKPFSSSYSVDTLLPANIATSTMEALSELQDRVGDIDTFVAGSLDYKQSDLPKYFSAEQIDAIALAIDNNSRGSGFIIGDQTGVGKGRFVAAMIRYAMKQGRTPMFVTEKTGLYKDMYRDLSAIGMADIKDKILMTNAGAKTDLDESGTVQLKTPKSAEHNQNLLNMAVDGALDPKYSVIFTTYDQMNDQKSPRRTFLQAMAEDGFMILDESHNAGGSGVEVRKTRKNPNPVPRSKFVRSMIGDAHSVVYSSATYAKRPNVMDLYFKTDMALAVDDISELAEIIEAGGIPMQQVLASMLAEAGQYLRREKSFEGVEYETKPYPVDKEAANGIAEALTAITSFEETVAKPMIKDMNEELAASGVKAAGKSAGKVESTNFTSVMHNIVDQMLLALKARHAVEEATKSAKEGKSVVLTVANTMGSFIKTNAQTNDLLPGDPIDITFNDVLQRYLKGTTEYTAEDADGYKVKGTLLANMSEANKKKYRAVEEKINSLKLEGVPLSPIDYMHNELNKRGLRTAEITGRSEAIDYSGETPIYRRRSGKDTSTDGRNRTITAFNSGDVNAVILNQSGSTGISLHASKDFKNQNQRHMIVVQAEKNIDTHMQMLGRVHRTGQVVTPLYTQAVADIPAEMRPAAVLLAKMASMSANTTGRKGSVLSDKKSVDFMNKYGDQVIAEYMENNRGLNARLGNPLKPSEEGSGYQAEGAARKVTGRIAMLPIKEQEQLYSNIADEYRLRIEQLDAMGENDLEAKTLELDARTVKEETIKEGARSDSPFASDVTAAIVDVKRLGKPYTPEQLFEMLGKNVGNKVDTLKAAKEAWQKDGGRKLRDAIDEFEAYRVEALDGLESMAAKDNTRERLDSNKDRFMRTAGLLVGGDATIRFPSGDETTAVLVNVEKKGNTKNPLALSAWRMTFAVADSSRRLTLPMSKVHRGMVDGELMPGHVQVLNNSAQSEEFVVGLFKNAQKETRERRVIIGGNLLSGFSMFKKGIITNYTTADGQIRQGIMMPRSFVLDKELRDQRVKMVTPAHVKGFLVSPDRMVETKDGTVAISKNGVDYTIKARGAKRAQFARNELLTDAIGQDFVGKSGNKFYMAQFPENNLQAVMDALRDLESNLYAKSFLPAARKVAGVDVPDFGGTAEAAESPKYSKSAQTKANNTTTNVEKEAKTFLGKGFDRLKDAGKLKVVQSVEDLPGGVDAYGKPLYSKSGDIAGMYRNGTIYLVADQIAKGEAVNVLKHEGLHMLLREDSKFASLKKQLLNQVRLKKKSDAQVKEAYAAVPNDTQAKYRDEEALAYLVQNHKQHSIVKRAIAAVRAWMLRNGIPLKNITVDDMAALASQGIKSASRKGSIESVLDSGLQEAMYSRRRTKGTEAQEKALKETQAVPTTELSWKERMDKWVKSAASWSDTHSFRQALLDEFDPVERAERQQNEGALPDAEVSATGALRGSKNLDSVMAAIFMRGKMKRNENGWFELIDPETGKGFMEIFEPLFQYEGGSLVRLWEGYAGARRAAELKAQNRENNYSQEQIDELLKLENEYNGQDGKPDFKAIFDEYQSFNKNILDLAEDSGVIDPETRKVWESNDYIPMYRILEAMEESAGPKGKKGVASQTSGIRKLKGGVDKHGGVMENMVMNMTKLVDASYKNVAAERAIDLGLQTGHAEKVAGRAAEMSEEQVREYVNGIGLDYDAMDDTQKGAWKKTLGRFNPEGENIVFVLKNGKREYYEVSDPLFLKSLQGIGGSNSNVLKLFRMSKSLLTNTVTVNPSFMIANYLRDSLSTWVVTGTKMIPILSGLKQGVKAWREDAMLWQMMASGAGGGRYYNTRSSNVRKMANQMKKRMKDKDFSETVLDSPGKVWRFWQKVGNVSENANRLAVMQDYINKGASVTEAAHQAMDVLNFTRHGGSHIMRLITDTVPFLNARVQGLDRLYRGAKENPGTFAARGALLAMASLALFAMNKDREEYNDLPEWDKDIYWHFFTPFGHYRFPKPFEVGAIFGTLPERIGEALDKGETRFLSDSVMRTIRDTLAFDPIPQLVRPAYELAIDRNRFFDSPIVGFDKYLEPEAQYNTRTAVSAVKLAEAMPDIAPDFLRSPKQLEHLIYGYTSAVGSISLWMADRMMEEAGITEKKETLQLTEMPVIKRFFREHDPRSVKYASYFYDIVNEADKAYKTINKYKKHGRMDAAREIQEENQEVLRKRIPLNRVKQEISEINRRMDRIAQSKFRKPEDKDQAIRRLTQRKNDLYKRAMERYGEGF